MVTAICMGYAQTIHCRFTRSARYLRCTSAIAVGAIPLGHFTIQNGRTSRPSTFAIQIRWISEYIVLHWDILRRIRDV